MLLWEIEILGNTLRPVALIRSDNMRDEVKELRVLTPDGKQIATMADVDWFLVENGMLFEGYVARPRRRSDPMESWFARPLSDEECEPVAWRVEIVTREEPAQRIVLVEPAVVEEVQVVRNGKALRLLRELEWDEYIDLYEEAESMVLIRDQIAKRKRWIWDYDIHHLNRYELSLTGVARHRGGDTEAIVRLTPSGIARAAALLGLSSLAPGRDQS